MTGSPRGIEWLASFNASCLRLNPGSNSSDEDNGNNEGGCIGDFIPIHWYGNFEGLASHMGQVRALYPSIPMWVTEYGLPNNELEATQEFFNSSMEYFDRMDYVERYSYFGAFRSDVSNVGGNSALLTEKGELTDIGSWYLGGVRRGIYRRVGGGGEGWVGADGVAGRCCVGFGFGVGWVRGEKRREEKRRDEI